MRREPHHADALASDPPSGGAAGPLHSWSGPAGASGLHRATRTHRLTQLTSTVGGATPEVARRGSCQPDSCARDDLDQCWIPGSVAPGRHECGVTGPGYGLFAAIGASPDQLMSLGGSPGGGASPFVSQGRHCVLAWCLQWAGNAWLRCHFSPALDPSSFPSRPPRTEAGSSG